jgi:hypothetical protein
MNTNYWKIFTGLAFVAFAAISCWATAESLHFSLPSWPVIACWVISIGFFVVASIGTAMIVNSLNQNVFVENRGWKFVGGLLMALVFWLLCSMPTNTHTFFYRSDINGVVSEDLSKTENYLNQLANAKKDTDALQEKKDDLENKVKERMENLRSEIVNELNPGVGPEARRILDEIATILGETKLDDNSRKAINMKDAETLYNWHREKIYRLLNSKKEEIDRDAEKVQSADYIPKAKELIRDIKTMQNDIEDGKLNLFNAQNMDYLTDRLDVAYGHIKTYKNYVIFTNIEDEALYTAENPISKTQSMVSVFNVWKDFLHGKYRGHGLWYWVVIAILLDVAAFIFFDITFAKRDDA